MKIKMPISVGEVVDKLTILEIKKQKISDPKKLENVIVEYNELKKLYEEISLSSDVVDNLLELIALKADLFEVNRSLWVIEDNIREKERIKDFGPEFIRLARDVYHANDIRYSCKNEINILFNSHIKEEKSYESYS
tara:strand:+ start:121 stop:528 length:408 start_codon:yes stop_codon:yes gene_type:complete